MIGKIFQSDSTTKTKKRKQKNKRRKRRSRKTGGSGSGSHIPPVFGPNGPNGNGHRSYARTKSKSSNYKLPRVAPWKIIVASFAIGICGVLYISHVFQTQQLLKEVKQLEQQYERVHRQHEQHELQYERITGPRQIYENAQKIGFISGGPVEKVITIEE